jgi:four helix bundle protein
MGVETKSPQDIHQRIYIFVVNCFKVVVRKIPKTVENNPSISQSSSSLTSMGANDQEADAAESRKDFIAKYTIVKKETKETRYWLSFIRDLNLVPDSIVDKFLLEVQEILLIVSKIILNSKTH